MGALPPLTPLNQMQVEMELSKLLLLGWPNPERSKDEHRRARCHGNGQNTDEAGLVVEAHLGRSHVICHE